MEQVKKCLKGQEDIHSLLLNAWFTVGVGMASEKLGKSVLGLDEKPSVRVQGLRDY